MKDGRLLTLRLEGGANIELGWDGAGLAGAADAAVDIGLGCTEAAGAGDGAT